MSSGQKIIKILATIFAVFLAVTIIGGIIGGIFFALNLDSKNHFIIDSENVLNDPIDIQENNSNNTQESSGDDTLGNTNFYDFTQTYTNINSFDIEATINRVVLIEGNEFRVNMENVSTSCSVYEDHGVLTIEDTNHSGRSFLSWVGDLLDGKGFSGLRGGTITVTYPEGFTAQSCDIEAGTGSVSIDDLTVDKLYIESGTGSISGNNITANYMDLQCGTGSVDLNNSSFAGSDIETGTGSVTINGRMTGQTSVECGVGSVYLGLEDIKDSYNLSIEKGLGGITIDGSSYSSINTTNPNASNNLSIEGGIGSVTIDFAKQF